MKLETRKACTGLCRDAKDDTEDAKAVIYERLDEIAGALTQVGHEHLSAQQSSAEDLIYYLRSEIELYEVELSATA